MLLPPGPAVPTAQSTLIVEGLMLIASFQLGFCLDVACSYRFMYIATTSGHWLQTMHYTSLVHK